MPELLSAQDLMKLPLRAIVAFAARCARRVQPLYDLPKEDQGRHRHVAALNDAAEVAERFGRDASNANAAAAEYAARAADAAAQTAVRVYAARAASADYAANAARGSVASHAARAAAAAAYAARDAAQASFADERSAATHAAAAADNAAAAAADAAVADNAAAEAGFGRGRTSGVQIFVRRDYEWLLALELGNYPDLGKPIDATEAGPLGPLWLGETPAWYTDGMPVLEANEPPAPPALEIYIDPGNASKETIEDVLAALSDLHVAAGGLGLEFKVDGNTVLASQEVSK